MRVRRIHLGDGNRFELLDDEGRSVPEVEAFLRHLQARGCSPNTLSAYAHDLLRFYRFLAEQEMNWDEFTAARSLAFLEYLRTAPSRNRAQWLSPVLVADGCSANGRAITRLSPATVNRAIAAVSSFYEFLLVSGRLSDGENPIRRKEDPAFARVPERPRPFLAGIANRKRLTQRTVRAKTVVRVPRPMSEEQVEAFFGGLKKLRDRAMFLLMLQGGLRPGEVLNLRLEDIQYGRRRVVVRHREDHPKGARTKSRTERVVDLCEPEALAAVSSYVMRERPRDAKGTFVFLVGGNGKWRLEPLSYSALVKIFARVSERVGIREPWVTPHSLRHTHATRMWEGGMRELALQKRLGHASPESTRAYTRVSDVAVLEEYRRALGKDGS